MKRILVSLLVVALLILAPLAALGDEPQTAAGVYEGIYEGEYDANGQRSGYGTWTYANHLYAGRWENDLPNGEGTLYSGYAMDWTADFCSVVQGTWVDGFAEGTILVADYWRDDGQTNWNSNAFCFDVEKGRPKTDTYTGGLLWLDGNPPEETDGNFNTDWLIGGVAPWAEADIDPAVSPPQPGLFELHGPEVADTINKMNAAYANMEGTYEGEYDANGLRSGQGTWTCQNFVYVGQWQNDMPNGEGTLYEGRPYDVRTGSAVNVVQGNWVDGFADGPAWIATYFLEDGKQSSGVYHCDITKGFVWGNVTVPRVYRDAAGVVEFVMEEPIPSGLLLGGVPPWARVELDASASVPPLDTLDVAAWDTDAFLAAIAEEDAKAEALAQYEGTYEGEYDANGQRSGQGTWTYHNFRYVGEWANDLPNGEGTLYEGYQYPDFPSHATVIQGHWVDGCADGLIILSEHSADGEEFVYSAVVEQGRVPRSMTVDGMNRINWEIAYAVAQDIDKAGNALMAKIETDVTNTNEKAEAMEAEGITTEEILAMVAEDEALLNVETEVMLTELVATGEEKAKQAATTKIAALLADYSVEDFSWRGTLYNKGDLVAGVPPWAEESYIRPECDPPEPDAITLPPWGYAELIVAVAPDFATDDITATDDEGDYQGDRDTNGLRSGQGTWAYHNLLYVGQWRNDMPNGEGTLYFRRADRDYETNAITGQHDMMVRGNWKDGAASEAVEVTFLNEDAPLVMQYNNVYEGMFRGRWPYTLAANARVINNGWHLPMGELPPWFAANLSEVDAEVGTPWDLYEQYPDGKLNFAPPERIENTGVSITPGNLANGSGMAALGDWIFMSARQDDLVTVYKMRADGTQTMKIFEHNNDYETRTEYWSPDFQVIGDWLYAGYPYKMRADELSFTRDEAYLFRTAYGDGHAGEGQGLVADEWVYQLVGYPADVLKISLDYTKFMVLGGREHPENPFEYGKIIAVDADWVYVHRQGNDENHYYNEIIRAKTDGSGKAQVFSLRAEHSGKDIAFAQVVGGKLYGAQEQSENGRTQGYRLVSVDLDAAGAPVPVPLCSVEEEIGALHVTDEGLYYGRKGPGQKTYAIVRVNHDGSDPVVLADGLHNVNSISIAGDWLMFEQYNGNTPTSSLMRLDGSGLHKLGESFVPEDAPGITDATGKWRYELLADGSAMILSAGSKLKQTGKLAIPAAVDKIPVTAIGANAFYGCESFTGVSIPKSVTSIGDFAFFWCQGLTEITVPEGVTSIGEGAFQGCSKVKKVSLPASLTSVGKQAFADCPSAKLSVAKKNEVFEVVDGTLFDRVRNAAVE